MFLFLKLFSAFALSVFWANAILAATVSIKPVTGFPVDIEGKVQIFKKKESFNFDVGSSLTIGSGDTVDLNIANRWVSRDHLHLIKWPSPKGHPDYWAIRNNSAQSPAWVNGNFLAPGTVLGLDPCGGSIRISLMCSNKSIDLYTNLTHPVKHLENPFCSSAVAVKRVRADYPKFSKFEVINQLGEGGFGLVYLARVKQSEGQLVTIKQLTPKYDKNYDKRKEHFKREADLLKKFQKIAGIPKLIKTLQRTNIENPKGEPDLYIVMEYIQGEDLDKKIERYRDEGQLIPTHLILTWMIKLLKVLEKVHDAGHMHRDIKPANMMIRASNGEIYLIDLGASSKEQPSPSVSKGTMIGTSGYSHPMQFIGQANVQTELYSVGMSMFNLLTEKILVTFGPWDYSEKILLRKRKLLYKGLHDTQKESLVAFYKNLSQALRKAIRFQEVPLEYGSAREMRKDLQNLLYQYVEINLP